MGKIDVIDFGPILDPFRWARARGPNSPKRGQTGGQRAETMCGTLGPFKRVETTKTQRRGEGRSRNHDSVFLAPDTTDFRFRTLGCKLDPNGAELGQPTPFMGGKCANRGEKAA